LEKNNLTSASCAVINLAVAITVFTKLHGHCPLDTFTTSFLNVALIILFFSGFYKSLICFEEGLFEIICFYIKWKRFYDFSFLTIGVRENDFDSRF
tara:strand:- start:659 stop:946 length:288 start_codon:yes stop_codon:yes gene_type:complete